MPGFLNIKLDTVRFITKSLVLLLLLWVISIKDRWRSYHFKTTGLSGVETGDELGICEGQPEPVDWRESARVTTPDLPVIEVEQV